MGKYRAYPEYKDSGVEWLPLLPKGWEVKRGKYLFNEINRRSVDGRETLLSVSEYYGVKPRAEVVDTGEHLSRAESLEGYKCCEKNDLVMNIMLAWKRGLGVTKYDGIVSPAYSVFRFENDIDPDFMHYLLRTDMYTGAFKCKSSGVIDSRLRLYPDSFGTVEIVKPSFHEQTQIAAFLDRETAKIDRLIEKQETLIELLKEKRQAVISHAVTKGLDPDAPMKDSGVEWLGEIPAHWEVKLLRRCLSIIEQGWSPEAANRPAQEGEKGVIKLSAVKKGRFYPQNNKTLDNAFDLQKRLFLQKGDLLLTRANTPALVGDACVVGDVTPKQLLLCDLVYRLKVEPTVLEDYLCYWLISNHGRMQIVMDARGSSMTMAKISQEHIKSWLFPTPPKDEQHMVVEHLNKMTEKIDAAIFTAEDLIALLQERRTALISAAVTGKIDVREEM